MFSGKENWKDLDTVQRGDGGEHESGFLMTWQWSAREAVFCDDSPCSLEGLFEHLTSHLLWMDIVAGLQSRAY